MWVTAGAHRLMSVTKPFALSVAFIDSPPVDAMRCAAVHVAGAACAHLRTRPWHGMSASDPRCTCLWTTPTLRLVHCTVWVLDIARPPTFILTPIRLIQFIMGSVDVLSVAEGNSNANPVQELLQHHHTLTALSFLETPLAFSTKCFLGIFKLSDKKVTNCTTYLPCTNINVPLDTSGPMPYDA